jgi:hypothetical protein
MAELKPYNHEHENEVTVFAETNFRNQRRQFGIKTDDRRRHVYIIGKTGMGKTTLMENMVLADIHAGHGVAYIDPHGDTAQKILDYIPPHRINDVVYLNPADMDFPVGFNILESINPDKKHLVAAGLMGVFKKIWPDVWSARMEYILLNTILALLDAPGSTLLGINRLLVDPDYRKRVVSLIQDPVVKTFWVKEFAAFSEKYRTEAIAPVQNKVGQFLSASIIRNIVAQVKSTIDIREIMDQRKILILNLAKGLIGEENSRLLGGMIVTRLQLAAMERVDIPEKERQDFYLYVDEFQNFATTSFANILSEARKYRLNLIVAHQYIEQLTSKGDTDIRDAIFGNVGTIVVFRVGAADAEFMETEFTPRFLPEDLVNLGKYDIYLKLMIDGASSEPFSATTLPPIAKRTGSTDKVIKVSRERNARPRSEIEDKVLRWSGMGTVDEGALIVVEEEGEEGATEEKLKALEASSPKIQELSGAATGKKDKPQFEIACSVCGKVQKLNFEPDWSRPWFCKDDLEKRRLQMEEQRQAGTAPPAAESRPPQAPHGPGPARPRPPAAAVIPRPMPAAPPKKPMAPPKQAAAAPLVSPEVKPVSLSALFGKKIEDGPEMEIVEEGDDDTEENAKPEKELTPLAVAGAGLVEIGVGKPSRKTQYSDRNGRQSPYPRPAAGLRPPSPRPSTPVPFSDKREVRPPSEKPVYVEKSFAGPTLTPRSVGAGQPHRMPAPSVENRQSPSPVIPQTPPMPPKPPASPPPPPAVPTPPSKPTLPPPPPATSHGEKVGGKPIKPGEVVKF